ncbi:MBL fold metallo-hydrolase [Rubritalea spongiae]|uniref:MBL fold metallo-hydrolase n=1 Tax=Rubritalea spongiae TaxID=430797 RepID=A0ABW5E285_9BACT
MPIHDSHSRRNFIGLSSALLGAQLLSASAKAQGEKASAGLERNPTVYSFMIGDIEAWSISDGRFDLRAGLKLMYPEAERVEMLEVLERYSEPTDSIPLYVNILVIRKGKEVVVFDAGFGAPRGWFYDGLKQIGIHPDEVTAGMLSHAHTDHLVGFVKNGEPYFKNAKIYVTPEELGFWTQSEPDFSMSRRDPKSIPRMVKTIKKQFKALENVLVEVKAGTELFDGLVRVENGFGHTPGHVYFRICSGEEELVHISDLAHHHLLMFDDPTWCIGFDHNPTLAVESRKRVFSELAEKRSRAYGFHLAYPGLGRILATEKGYRWSAERFEW